jgi:hypothetical protein
MDTFVRHLLAFAAITSAVMPLPAQETEPLGAARVTLVAGPAPSRGGRTEVVRRAQRTPQNLVLVDRNATAEDLAAALGMITALRAQYGDALTSDIRARPETVRPGPNWQRSAYRTWLIELLARLRTAPPGSVSDLGIVKAVQITLPAPSGVASESPGGRR